MDIEEAESEDDAVPAGKSDAPSQRAGVALCLSGGGYRAALFHLGALRRLNECGILGWLDTIVSVSGGSIAAAHLARAVAPWPEKGKVFADWDRTVAAPLRAFCRVDVRTPAAWRGLKRPVHTAREGGIPAQVVDEAVGRLLHPGALQDLPIRPRFIIQASDVDAGTLFRFQRDRLFMRGRPFSTRPDDRIARAVAASACFPPLFAPIPASDDPARFMRKGKGAGGLTLLSDGGLYDNLGLQPVIRSHKTILISDAGAPWDYSARPRGVTRLVGHYPSVLMRQVESLRRSEWFNLRDNRWLHPHRRIEGVWWSLVSPKPPTDTEDDPPPRGPRPASYPDAFLQEFVVKCRTDLNTFTATEAGVLENAGYMNCAIALHDRLRPVPGLPEPPAPQWPDQGLADFSRAEPYLHDISERMPGGWLRFVWHLMCEHKLPKELPIP